ncbi:MAG: hypothetical protein V2J25_00305 [Desulfatiglans sp.]|nr:hypothetical protein [Desulfatiglans sp.]
MKKKKKLKDIAVKSIVNTCYLWREHGPLVSGLWEAEKTKGETEIT